jgi:hypothetical protein
MRNFTIMGCVVVSAAFLSIAAQSAASAQPHPDPPRATTQATTRTTTTGGAIGAAARSVFPTARRLPLNITSQDVETIVRAALKTVEVRDAARSIDFFEELLEED